MAASLISLGTNAHAKDANYAIEMKTLANPFWGAMAALAVREVEGVLNLIRQFKSEGIADDSHQPSLE